MMPVKRKKVNKPVSISCSAAGELIMLDTEGSVWYWCKVSQNWYPFINASKTLERLNAGNVAEVYCTEK